MSYTFHAVSLLAALFLLVACGHTEEKKPAPKIPTGFGDILYSPNAEPLSGGVHGHPDCKTAITAWFDRTDLNHDGKVTRGEFMKDAEAQFTHMDIDHNGFLASEEIGRYRDPFRVASSIPVAKPKKGEKPELPANLSDPVMSADSNLDFKVTPDEWRTQQSDVFARLDTNHDIALSRDEALAFCQ